MLIRSSIFALLAAVSTAALSPTTVNAQMRPPPQQHPGQNPLRPPMQQTGGPLHMCPAGQSWQYGCVQYGPAGPGQLFGACLRSSFSCTRSGGQIQ
jgi:hypothetical protein